jgi:repressor LexA
MWTRVYTVDVDKTTKNDLKGYGFIRNEVAHNGATPSLREIMRAVGYNSPRSVQLMLRRLHERGLIYYIDGKVTLRRGKGAPSERTVEVPLVGSVACGTPSLAEQDPEALIHLSTQIARPGHEYFLLRAQGTSMNKSGIKDGDLVLVRQQSTAEEGEKIVALINDDATIKLFHREGDVVVLRPNSSDKKHKPIILSEDFIIQGVVAAVLPQSIY